MSKKATNRKRTKQLNDMEFVLNNNIMAQVEGPKRKKWSLHDLKQIQPLTDTQAKAFEYWFESSYTDHLAMLGCAGVGKSLLAVYMAMNLILDPNTPYRSLKIVRSVVQTRQIGAIPGDLLEKKMPIYNMYSGILSQLFGRKSTFEDMITAGLVELVDTTYIRGDTWDDSIVFVDEVNNLNDHELHTVMTRVGQNTRVIVAGDKKQSDLAVLGNKADKFNYELFVQTIQRMSSFGIVFFTYSDIVRSDFVKQWICAQDGVPFEPTKLRHSVVN